MLRPAVAMLWIAIGVAVALLVVLPIVGFRRVDGIVGALMGLLGAFVLGLVGVSVAYSYTYAHYDERVIECTVTGLETRGSGTPFIATEQCGVLEGSGSSPIWRRGDSVDVSAQIQLGQTYRFRVVGWRSWWTGPSPRVLRIEAFS